MTTNKATHSAHVTTADDDFSKPRRRGRELTATELNSVAGGGLLSSPVGLSAKALLPARGNGIIAILIGL